MRRLGSAAKPSLVTRAWLIASLLLALGTSPVHAEKPPRTEEPQLSSLPGYFPLEELKILNRKELSTEINLKKPLLKIVAAVTRKEEPGFSKLVESLDAIRVWIAEPEDIDLVNVRARVEKAADWLEAHHWNAIIRTRDDGEEVHIYLRELEGEIAGMAVLAIGNDNEVALINIVGAIDLAQLERLSEAFNLPDLSLPEN